MSERVLARQHAVPSVNRHPRRLAPAQRHLSAPPPSPHPASSNGQTLVSWDNRQEEGQGTHHEHHQWDTLSRLEPAGGGPTRHTATQKTNLSAPAYPGLHHAEGARETAARLRGDTTMRPPPPRCGKAALAATHFILLLSTGSSTTFNAALPATHMKPVKLANGVMPRGVQSRDSRQWNSRKTCAELGWTVRVSCVRPYLPCHR